MLITKNLVMDAERSSTPEPIFPEPTFRATHVQPGRKTCHICFTGCEKRNSKRAKFERITDVDKFKNYAVQWQNTSHLYNRVFDQVMWSSVGEHWAHKLCKSQFFRDSHLHANKLSPTELTETKPKSPVNACDDSAGELSPETFRRSTRNMLTYTSSWQQEEHKKCIICNEDKWVKGRLVPIQTISVTDKSEKTLIEYANIHLTKKNTKYMDGAQRILLTLSTKSLLAADVGYHKKMCYEPFRSPVWKRVVGSPSTTTSNNDGDDEALCEMYHLVEIHIIRRQETYTMTQLKSVYNQIRNDKDFTESRSLELKQQLRDKFGSKLNFHKSTQRTIEGYPEYVFPANVEFSANCVESTILGKGMAKSVLLKGAAKSIHESIRSSMIHLPWPPTPQDILEKEPDLNCDLMNYHG